MLPLEFISNVSRVAYEVVFNVVPAGLGVVAVGAGELLVGDADEVGFDGEWHCLPYTLCRELLRP